MALSVAERAGTEQEAGVERRRGRFVGFTIALGIGWSFACSYLGGGWVSASIIVVIITGLQIGFVVRYRDGVLGRLLLLGVAAGFAELLADRWLVDSTRTLTYAPEGPFLWRSPLYMPLAWANIVTALGYIGWRVAQHVPLRWATFGLALFSATYIPGYEFWADGAGWWSYQGTPKLGATPWYIILGELLLALVVPLAAIIAVRSRPAVSVLVGLGVGLWIWGAYAIAFALVG